MSSGGDGVPRRRPVLVWAAVALLALVVIMIASATTGSWDWPGFDGGATPSGTDSVTIELPTAPTETVSSEEPAEESAGEGNDVIRWLIIGVVALLGVGLLLLLARLIASLLRSTELEPVEPRLVGQVGADEVDVPIMRDGLAQAQQALDSGRPPRDAIVLAWVALEKAAADAGAARLPAQTPTEFVAVVLRRTPADADAVETLRGLYEHARFSKDEVTDSDAQTARTALAAIAASWADLEVAP